MTRRSGSTGLLLAVALVGLAGAGRALAEPSPPHPWSPDGAMDGGNDRNSPFKVRTVARGEAVRGLPMAARQIDPTWRHGERDWTVKSYMAAYNVSGVMVLRNGEIVLERYGQGRQPTDRWMSQSVAKSVTSLLAGAAVHDGRLRLSDTVARHMPELKGSAYADVTVRQLLTMSSGVKWDEAYQPGSSDLWRYYQAALAPGGDAVTDVQAKLPSAAPAGTRFHYNTAETHLAGLVVSRATGQPLSQYLSEKIWRPFGMARDAAWRVDPKGRELAGCCLLATLDDFARLGQFVLEDGVADGRRITAKGWVSESTRRQIDNGRSAPAGYGYFWWIGPEAFEASGIYGQSILIYPKDRVVIVVNSEWEKPDGKDLFAALGAFQKALRDAAVEQAP